MTTEESFATTNESSRFEHDKASQENELITSDGKHLTMMEALRQIAHEMVTVPVNFILGKAGKPRRWVFDRCDGTSDFHDHHRPPCPICYVPIPVKWFPDLLEQNNLCERFGQVGCVRPYDYGLRKVIFGIATLCQFIAFSLTFYAAFAISKKYNILRKTSFTHGTARIIGGRLFNGDSSVSVRVDIGLLAIGIEDPENYSGGYNGRVISWDEFCGPFHEEFDDFFEPRICRDCGQQSKALVATMIMSLLFSIPSFTTDILRFYPDYDVNCQKFFGSVVSLLSMFSSLYTWRNYHQNCVSAFYSSEVGIYENRTVAARMDEGDLILDFDWEAGWGYIFVVLATLLKIVDVICNLAVPTPEICRDRAEQHMYEIVAMNRDINDGVSSYYTGESISKLYESVRMAKEESSRFRKSVVDDCGLGNVVESVRGGESNRLEAIDEEDDVASSLPSAKAATKSLTTPLDDVAHAATPAQRNRLHNSVYF